MNRLKRPARRRHAILEHASPVPGSGLGKICQAGDRDPGEAGSARARLGAPGGAGRGALISRGGARRGALVSASEAPSATANPAHESRKVDIKMQQYQIGQGESELSGSRTEGSDTRCDKMLTLPFPITLLTSLRPTDKPHLAHLQVLPMKMTTEDDHEHPHCTPVVILGCSVTVGIMISGGRPYWLSEVLLQIYIETFQSKLPDRTGS